MNEKATTTVLWVLKRRNVIEQLLDTLTQRAVSHIEIKEGTTKLLSLKIPATGAPPDVVVQAQNTEVAFCFPCSHLKDASKHHYNDIYDVAYFSDQTIPIRHNNEYIFQVTGRAPGQTDLTVASRSSPSSWSPYASPVSIVVKANPKRLLLKPAAGSSVPAFQTLWDNHPLNPKQPGGPVHYPCDGKALGNMQCMVRLCTALERSGVSFSGLFGWKCGVPGQQHAHHFANPYDFERWSIATQSCYVWKATPPLQPEPMPGLAAYWFVLKRQGIILFWNYFDPKGSMSMFGGHIDLWNKGTMGNTYDYANPTQGEAAFFRARQINFWPLV